MFSRWHQERVGADTPAGPRAHTHDGVCVRGSPVVSPACAVRLILMEQARPRRKAFPAPVHVIDQRGSRPRNPTKLSNRDVTPRRIQSCQVLQHD